MSEDVLHVVAVARDPRTQALLITLSDGAVLATAPQAPEASDLRPGDAVDAACLAALRAAAQRKGAAQRAMRLLGRRRYSRHRLEDKLREAGEADAAVESIVRSLVEQGLLDDVAFARAYCRDQLARRPVGRAWLLRGLRAQGVGAEDARAGLDVELPSSAELPLALAALRRRLGSTAGDGARSLRFLIARGFAPAVAREAVSAARQQREQKG